MAIPSTTTPATMALSVAAVQAQISLRNVSPTDSGEEQVVSSTSSPAGAVVREPAQVSGNTTELIGENERLKKENMQLNKELSQMKSLCNNIFVLMSNYASSDCSSNNNNNNGQSAETSQPLKALDLLPARGNCPIPEHTWAEDPMELDEASARLFGVAIGLKRARENGGVMVDNDRELQLQQPGNGVKSEPLDLA